MPEISYTPDPREGANPTWVGKRGNKKDNFSMRTVSTSFTISAAAGTAQIVPMNPRRHSVEIRNPSLSTAIYIGANDGFSPADGQAAKIGPVRTLRIVSGAEFVAKMASSGATITVVERYYN